MHIYVDTCIYTYMYIHICIYIYIFTYALDIFWGDCANFQRFDAFMRENTF